MSTTGVITSITQDWRGDMLAVAASSGDTVLAVDNAGDFSDDAATVPRYLLVGGESTPRQYAAVDPDANTVTLSATVGGSGLEAGLPLVLWDPTVGDAGSQTVEYVASVQLHDGSGSPDAVVPHDTVPNSGVFGLVGATVSIDQDDDEGDWFVAHVLGREPVVDTSFSPPGSAPWIPDGEPPTEASVVTARGGIGALAVTWTEVANADPVTYRLHIAADTDPATDGTMEVASGIAVTAALVRTLTDGTPVLADGSVTYHCIVSVEDADGRGPDSDAAEGVPAQVTGPDIAVDALTANHLLSNDAFIGALQAVDFSAVTITGPTIQTEATENRGVKLSYDPDGGAYLRAWTSDGTKFFDVTPNQGVAIVNGEATLNELTTVNSASLGGTTAIKSGGSLVLQSGAALPTNKPLVGSTYDTLEFDDDGFWGTRTGLAFDGTYYYTARVADLFGAPVYTLEKWNTSGAMVGATATPLGSGLSAASVAVGGGKVYVGTVRPGVFSVYRWTASTLAFEASANWSGYDPDEPAPAIGFDPTSGATNPLLFAQGQSSGKTRIYRGTFTGSTVSTPTTLDTTFDLHPTMTSLLYAEDVGGDGAFDFTVGGPGRYLIAGATSTNMFAVNGSTGARRTTDEWPLAIADKVGVIWNGTIFQSLDRSGVMRDYSAIDKATDQTDASTTKWVSSSYFRDNVGTDWETGQSPKTKVVQFPKRSKMTVTGPSLAASPGANDPTAVQFYVGSGTSEPADSAMWRQTSPSIGVTTATYTSLTTSGSAHPDAGTAFPASTPAQWATDTVASDTDPVAFIDSTGTGRLLKQRQSGSVTSGTVVAGASNTQSVSFLHAFDATPGVRCWVQSDPDTFKAWATSVTTSGFTINYRRETGTTSFVVRWEAAAPTQ